MQTSALPAVMETLLSCQAHREKLLDLFEQVGEEDGTITFEVLLGWHLAKRLCCPEVIRAPV